MVIPAFSDTQRVFEQIEATEKSTREKNCGLALDLAQSHKASLLPLCCALSAETANLPQAITVQTSLYFDMQIEWLTKVVRAGMESGEFSSHAEPSDIALMIINVCEGSSVVAHATARPEVFANSLKYIKLLLEYPSFRRMTLCWTGTTIAQS
ncbi:TetR/AcrR family transcriptional regulator [Pseudocitrobacter corydidari]